LFLVGHAHHETMDLYSNVKTEIQQNKQQNRSRVSSLQKMEFKFWNLLFWNRIFSKNVINAIRRSNKQLDIHGVAVIIFVKLCSFLTTMFPFIVSFDIFQFL